MPTRKIADLPPLQCRHPEHTPPSSRELEPGIYEHECPQRGWKCMFVVVQPGPIARWRGYKGCVIPASSDEAQDLLEQRWKR